MSAGRDRIAAAFARASADGRAAFIPYLMAGLPDDDSFVDCAVAAADAGADVLEVGIPWSDPLADGPTIQRAAEQALERGMTLARCLDLVRRIAERTDTPVVVMGYSNPVLRFGLERFCAELAAAGGAGMILPDMPPEEAGPLRTAADEHGLGVTFLVAPTSDDARVRQVSALGTGFLYCVSLTGVTGARSELPPDVAEFVARVRAASALPVAVGFGIAAPEQAAALAPHADGVVVGSALVAAVEEAGVPGAAAAVAERVAAFVDATRRAPAHA